MSRNFKDNFLFIIVIAVILIVGGPDLWGFDRSSQPTVSVTWELDKTVPDYPVYSPENPTAGARPNRRYDNTTQLRLYKNSNEVAFYMPESYRFFVIAADSFEEAYKLYTEIAVRFTYYFAKDRTTDIYGEDTPRQYRGGEHNIRGGEMFFNYIYKADYNSGYGNGEINNKYNLDQLTVVFEYDEFLQYIRNFTYESRYDYLDNNDLYGMKRYIAKVYSPETVWNNWFFTTD